MQLLTLTLFAAVLSATARPVRRAVDPALVPDFGVKANVNPTGTGDCDGIAGADGTPVKIPCQCPPDRDSFIQSLDANVAAGKVVNNPSVAVTFPEDNSTESQIARIQASLVTLQNLEGPGKGCPAASTTLLAQQKALGAGGSADTGAVAAVAPGSSAATSAAATSAAATSAATSTASGSSTSTTVDPALVPEFGLEAGLNPTGTGDCDGITGADGTPVKIPCQCPPDRDSFIQSLEANVAAGKVVNNPSVAVTFPEDNSTESQIARIQASLVTLQNLEGPGKGCPAASTTLLAQQKALAAGGSTDDGAVAVAASGSSAATSAAETSAAAATSPASASSSTAAGSSTSTTVDPALVPDLGLQAGLNPTGTGDCDGVAGANGQPIKIPCQCPPDQDTFIQSLTANVAAGVAVNNPDVAVTFPTGDTPEDQVGRIQASLVTLQNLEGPGKGCPAASTTLLAQMKALQGQ
ncbi:hypothetical protein BD626DRAFT_635277 [Schizophyllum amplum]|uniref:Uncharacterized protein n=1 Tax=Schizophyllum amplum TaxID=97359 RepID=A0A550BWQ4_9AGAR|nr:hypothetical protein BD626DRAFT_635277 [Auriculariopsis ampla]